MSGKKTIIQKLNIAVLISGNGSNLQALIDSSQHEDSNINIAVVVSNKSDAYGITRAKQFNIPTHVLSDTTYNNRESYDRDLISIIDPYDPKLVVLAGFMRILSPIFVDHYHGSLINIHPSLLPKYRGLNTHARVLEAKEHEHGASVHFVTQELDGGPLISRYKITVNKNDNVDILTTRIQEKEHLIYPIVVNWFARKKLSLKNNVIYFEGQPLATPIEFQDI